MIIEQHYDEEVLIGLLEEEAERDSHAQSCDTCSGTLDSLRDLTGALRDDSVWDQRPLSETPSAKTTDMLRAFAERTKAEDAAAGLIVAKLLAASPEERTALLEKNPQWRTAGVVRRLLKVVDDKNFSEPKLAADLAAFAANQAELIGSGQYPFDTVLKLRATAWRERGYSLYYIGQYADSLAAFDLADTYLNQCAVADLDSAQTALFRAQAFGELERLDEAIGLLDHARGIFARYGNERRVSVVDATKATLLMRARRFVDALSIHRRIEADPSSDENSRALALYHAAICYREQSRFADAKPLFVQAMLEFERLGRLSSRAKARWSLGSVLAAEQRYAEALMLFNQARGEFEEFGMAQDLALVSVDAAETLIMLERPGDVIPLCQSAMEYFLKAGLAYTQGALTALAYLKEAAATETLTTTTIGTVRAYFEVLPKQPNLLFASPA